MARLTHAVFSLVRPARFSGAVSVSVSKRLIVLVLAASRSPSRHGPHGWVLGQAVGIVGVLVARQPAIHRLPEQRYQMMLHVPAHSAIEMHSELSVGIFTHGVPPMALRLADVLPI